MNLVEHVRRFMDRHDLRGTAGVVACSGGPDSTLLTLLCQQLMLEGAMGDVCLAHVNHRLRGGDSDDDESFVRNLGARLGVNVHVAHRETAGSARDRGENLENQARTERYAYLEEVARQTGARWIATGHTADDQAETVLHHIVRGSGLAGWAGMAPQRPLSTAGLDLIRPLLDLRRADVLEALSAWAEPFRRDPSNEDRRFARNRLRHDVLPLLEAQFNPRLVEVLCRMGRQSREIHEYLGRQADDVLTRAECPRAGATLVLRADVLAKTDRVLVREAMRRLWQRENWPADDMTFEDWDMLARMPQSPDAYRDFPGLVHARRVRNVLQLHRTHATSQL
jgi:tRNA(Ile)-lysidine synthase